MEEDNVICKDIVMKKDIKGLGLGWMQFFNITISSSKLNQHQTNAYEPYLISFKCGFFIPIRLVDRLDSFISVHYINSSSLLRAALWGVALTTNSDYS